MKMILIRVLCILLLLLFVSTIFTGYGIFSFALRRGSVFSKDKTSQPASAEKKGFLLENGELITALSEDGLKLSGCFVKTKENSHNYAILCHGYTGDSSSMNIFAEKFHSLGFSVLAPDARAHGMSEGNVRGMGYPERRDIIVWINEILKKDKDAKILLFGTSMGGATVLFASGEKDLPSCVKAVISDCSFTDVYTQISLTAKRYASFLPSFPYIDIASLFCRIFGGYSFKEASCIEAVKRSTVPTLFIHGSEDKVVPSYMADILYENANCPKEKLIVEGAGHTKSVRVNPDLYWQRVERFLEGRFS